MLWFALMNNMLFFIALAPLLPYLMWSCFLKKRLHPSKIHSYVSNPDPLHQTETKGNYKPSENVAIDNKSREVEIDYHKSETISEEEGFVDTHFD